MVEMSSHSWADLADGAVWPGSVDEFVRLLDCVGAHCTCQQPEHLARGVHSCPAHQLLFNQRALDHLVFGHRVRSKLIASEFLVEPDSAAADPVPAPGAHGVVPHSFSQWLRALRRWFVSSTPPA